ncbi:hypothetical protein C499_13200 [Halogeometricum borinquense DSM 11551]|uniref:DUF1102 domain-containing protein n=2 Tax=Halogeometricum borinquense TaxID=60847 RepID=E4NUI5_HALBP|nr:hypothetical protein [Halogeometricum borinquense]ADQ68705.1 Protein of unknown function (DUF1102) [Halogeometricum borinquense DSM 11551]ELY25445.1 hypothetical protein C499_13200 [Halogeometricum borinquense DSM 11551]RYJ08655.1 hypothetical protein ELS19_19435 [Halogeometricum borinquense]
MAINRRNVLIGLGALVGGGGALVGTGAFTTVSAERTVSVSTAGDASAFLTITGDDEYVTDDSGDGTLTIDLGGPDGNDGASGFNEEAITTLTDVVTITNNASDGSSATVGVSTDGAADASANGSATLLLQDGNTDVAEVTFSVGGEDTNSIGSGSAKTLATGESAYLDVKIDTRQDTLDNSNADTGDLTIVAEEGSNNP